MAKDDDDGFDFSILRPARRDQVDKLLDSDVDKLDREFSRRDVQEVFNRAADQVTAQERAYDRERREARALTKLRDQDYDAFMREGGSDRLLKLKRKG